MAHVCRGSCGGCDQRGGGVDDLSPVGGPAGRSAASVAAELPRPPFSMAPSGPLRAVPPPRGGGDGAAGPSPPPPSPPRPASSASAAVTSLTRSLVSLAAAARSRRLPTSQVIDAAVLAAPRAAKASPIAAAAAADVLALLAVDASAAAAVAERPPLLALLRDVLLYGRGDGGGGSEGGAELPPGWASSPPADRRAAAAAAARAVRNMAAAGPTVATALARAGVLPPLLGSLTPKAAKGGGLGRSPSPLAAQPKPAWPPADASAAAANLVAHGGPLASYAAKHGAIDGLITAVALSASASAAAGDGGGGGGSGGTKEEADSLFHSLRGLTAFAGSDRWHPRLTADRRLLPAAAGLLRTHSDAGVVGQVATLLGMLGASPSVAAALLDAGLVDVIARRLGSLRCPPGGGTVAELPPEVRAAFVAAPQGEVLVTSTALRPLIRLLAKLCSPSATGGKSAGGTTPAAAAARALSVGAACALLAATDTPDAPEALKADATTALRVLAAAGHPHRALVLRQAAARVGVAAAAGRTVNGYVGCCRQGGDSAERGGKRHDLLTAC